MHGLPGALNLQSILKATLLSEKPFTAGSSSDSRSWNDEVEHALP